MFKFESVYFNDILREITNLNSVKNDSSNYVPTPYLKDVADTCSPSNLI